MKIPLPSGCNVYYGNYIDNYNGGQRTRYYIDENRLIGSSKTTATQPTTAICIGNELEVEEKFDVWAGIAAIILVGTIFIATGKIILGKFIGKR